MLSNGNQTHGSAIYARELSIVKNSNNMTIGDIEVLEVDLGAVTIIAVYKPPPSPFVMPELDLNGKPVVVVGDFNSHNTLWGYPNNNRDGELVEDWAIAQDLTLIHSAKHRPSFQSARWKRGYNPDLVFVSSLHRNCFKKSMVNPVPRS